MSPTNSLILLFTQTILKASKIKPQPSCLHYKQPGLWTANHLLSQHFLILWIHKENERPTLDLLRFNMDHTLVALLVSPNPTEKKNLKAFHIWDKLRQTGVLNLTLLHSTDGRKWHIYVCTKQDHGFALKIHFKRQSAFSGKGVTPGWEINKLLCYCSAVYFALIQAGHKEHIHLWMHGAKERLKKSQRTWESYWKQVSLMQACDQEVCGVLKKEREEDQSSGLGRIKPLTGL